MDVSGIPGTSMIRLVLAFAVLSLTAPVARAQENWDISGSWSGGYICNQGRTAVQLSIVRDARGNGVTATFSFGPVAANPGVPKGAYRMRGSFDPVDKALRLTPESWISQPPGYVMVGLDGLMRGSGLYIQGDVDGPGCSHFEVIRDSDLVG